MSKLNANSVELGTLTTTQRDALSGVVDGEMIWNSSTGSVQVYSPAGWIDAAAIPFSATGGTIITSGIYKYHVFTSPGTFTASGSNATAEVLVVGGGGGGSDGYGSAGGGAGSVVHATDLSISPGSYSVTIGNGGTGANSPGQTQGPQCVGGDGTNSSVAFPSPIVANGGGGGGSGHSSDPKPIVNGRPGGSGGGGGYYGQPEPPHGPNPGGTGTAPPTSPATAATSAAGGKSYQNPGGAGWYSGAGNLQVGGGGGGSGSGGASYNSSPKANGGAGQPFTSFPAPVLAPAIPAPVRPTWSPAVGPTGLFAGGGGAAHAHQGLGFAGGGNGSPPGGNGGNAVDYTGSGGGAAAGPAMGGKAGDGGNGIVIISYPTV